MSQEMVRQITRLPDVNIDVEFSPKGRPGKVYRVTIFFRDVIPIRWS
jgi:hypothetical protein